MKSPSIPEQLKEKFASLFGGNPIIVRSPGRVNIIGEHTDYNEGFVLPAAVDKAIYIAIGKREDKIIRLHAAAFNEDHEVSIDDLQKSKKSWANYILGVAAQFVKKGHTFSGFNLVMDGDVPIGGGLSSSAAVECAVAFGMNKLFGLNVPKLELALMAQKAEHEYAGVMCGIMDQFASTFGKKGHVIKLDCRSLEYEYVPFKLEGYKIVLLNTNVSHSLADSEYNNRRKQCEQGVAWINEKYENVHSLRDATHDMLDELVAPKDAVVYKRCTFVLNENERLLSACSALVAGDIAALGKKMYESHDGLSKEYEVSCAELDFLVDAVRNNPSVPGARMMGGGFGGCTINIVKSEAVDQLIDEISRQYKDAFGKDPSPFIAQIDEGSCEVTL